MIVPQVFSASMRACSPTTRTSLVVIEPMKVVSMRTVPSNVSLPSNRAPRPNNRSLCAPALMGDSSRFNIAMESDSFRSGVTGGGFALGSAVGTGFSTFPAFSTLPQNFMWWKAPIFCILIREPTSLASASREWLLAERALARKPLAESKTRGCVSHPSSGPMAETVLTLSLRQACPRAHCDCGHPWQGQKGSHETSFYVHGLAFV